MKRLAVTVTTDASGDASETSDPANGLIRAIRYVKTDYADTADFTITTQKAGQAVLTVSNVTADTTWHPRQATHDVTGVASLYAAAGEPVESDIPIENDRIAIVVAQGGATKTGTFHIWVG